MKRKRQNLILTIAGIVLTLPLLSACASWEREAHAVLDVDASSTLTIQDVWARSKDAGQNSAAYARITKAGERDDRLSATLRWLLDREG